MPQADIGIVPSTVFFLFTSFLLGYLVWVNFIFPRLVTVTRVKEVVKSIEEKDFFGSLDKLNDNVALTKLEKVSNKKFDTKLLSLSFLSFDPAVVLDLPSDEIPLLINFVLISLSFYFVLSGLLAKSHDDSRNFIKSICNFDFASTIAEVNQTRSNIVKYLRGSSLLGSYELARKWVSTRNTLVLPILKNSVVEGSQSLLSDIAVKLATKRSMKLAEIFGKAKKNQSKIVNSLFTSKSIRVFRLKSNTYKSNKKA